MRHAIADLPDYNFSLPPATQARYDYLIERRRAELLSPEEHAEMLKITDQAEALNVKFVEAIAELARTRGIPMESAAKIARKKWLSKANR